MTPLRAIICVVLFGLVMFGFNYLLHYAADSYGYVGLAVAIVGFFSIVFAVGKWAGADFS